MEDLDIREAIRRDPGLLLRAAARMRLLNFARYINPRMVVEPFHAVYYDVLDRFAHGRIKKLIIQMPPQHGKALPVDTPVLTTAGWKNHGDLVPGDYVFGDDGMPKRVLNNWGSYMWHTKRIDFDCGLSMVCAHEHLWKIYADRDNHRGRCAEIIEAQDIFARRHRRSPYVRADAVLCTADRDLPIDPYILGMWLGDGLSAQGVIICGEQDRHHFEGMGKITRSGSGYRVLIDGLSRKLRENNLLHNKHIPMEYLLAGVGQREALLRGLMDTDGSVDRRGRCEFSQMTGRLAEDVYVLLRSLGLKPSMREYDAYLDGRNVGRKVRICFSPARGRKIFSLPRKQERVDSKNERTDSTRYFIRSVREHTDCMVNCIQVEGGMYLAGRSLVPTHNSEGSSRMLPAFMLGLNPDLKIVIGSYAATVSRDFNADVQKIIDTREYQSVFPGTRLNGMAGVYSPSVYRRNTDVIDIVGRRGSLRVVGRGGSLTSKTVDISILDDVYKDYAEGNSPIVRNAAWKWYTTVVRTRLHNDSQELIVFTRWNDDDIIGRLEKSEEPIIDICSWSDLDNIPKGAWVRLNFEALKTGSATEIDPREVGAALWESKHSRDKLVAQKMLDPVQFNCLYQGNPGSSEGRMYQPFKTWVNKQDWGTFVRSGCYVDVADEGNDFLFAACYDIYRSPNKIFNESTRRMEPILYALITDMIYTRDNTDITTVTVPQMINRNGSRRAWIESNNGGSGFEKVVKKKVRALTIPFYQSGNKESRIVTSSAGVNECIIMPVGWEERFPRIYEALTAFLRDFKANENDDIADGLTGIYEKEIIDGKSRSYSYENRGVRIRN